MSNKYETKYGVNFAEASTYVDASSYKHSFRDYGMLPKNKMSVQPPDVRETFIEIAGKDGELDLTEVLTGYPSYGTRDGKFEFTVIDRSRWDYVYSRLMNEIHGKRMRVVLDEDNAWYYTGRVKVNSFKSKKNTATISVDAHLDPYKIARFANSEQWLWDPFNFETDVARDYGSLVVDGTTNYTIVGSALPVKPTFKASANGMKVKFKGTTYDLTKDTAVYFEGIVLRNEEYTMQFTGNGTVEVFFEIGSL